jgi:hypothetical protein
VEAASSNTFHQRALISRWWRSGSFAVTLRSACTVQRCSSAAGPQLADRLPQAGRPVGDDHGRRAQAAVDEVAAERQPALVALAAPERQAEQHLAALERDAPGDQHALRRLVVGMQLQIDRVQEAVDDVVL